MSHKFRMPPKTHTRARRAAERTATAIVTCFVTLLPVGCDSELDQVRSYKAPKENKQSQGPMVLQWDLPDGWKAKAGSGIRFASLSAGQGKDEIDVSIIRLAGAAGGVGPNINRWRGQIGLEPVTDADAEASATEIKARGPTGFLVDLTGPTDEHEDRELNRMMAAIFPADDGIWFIKTVAPRSTIEKHRSGFVELCNSVRFISVAAAKPQPASAAPPRSVRKGGPTWDAAPVDWKQDARPAAMSVASFTIATGGQQASLTITPLGGTQDLLGNINRWRRQVGLGPLASLDEAPPSPIEVAGQPGQLVDIVGSEKRILGAISSHSGQTWFYKLTGPVSLVGEQKAAFESFIRSIRF